MDHLKIDRATWDAEVAEIRRWDARLRAAGMRFGWSSTARYDVENMPAFVPAYVSVVRERFPELDDRDAIGAVLVYLSVFLTRDGKGIEGYVTKDVPLVMPLMEAAWWVCSAFVESMPETAVRLGWCRFDQEAQQAVEGIFRGVAEWMDAGGTLRFERAGVGLFLYELETGLPCRRPPNHEEFIVAGMSCFAAMKSELPEEIRKDVFRRHAAPFAAAVAALAERQGPIIAKKLRRKYDAPIEADDVSSSIAAAFVEKGHSVPLAFATPDGRVLPHKHTLAGANSVRDDLENAGDLVRPGRGLARPLSIDSESQGERDGEARSLGDSIATPDESSDPAHFAAFVDQVRLVRAVAEELRQARSAGADRYSAAIDYMSGDESRADVASRHGVTERELRSAESEIADGVLRRGAA